MVCPGLGCDHRPGSGPGLSRTWRWVSYTYNMAERGLHKEIRKAIAEAEGAGLRVVTFSGHTWGQVECRCGQYIKIYSTGRNPEFGAKLIRGFTRKHRDHGSAS
jgi:hypothetical protein